jgi:predicted RNA-binding protein
MVTEGGLVSMCEANAYLREGDREEMILEFVDRILPHEDGLLLEDIFGRRKIVKARIKELALVEHRIILEKI